MSSYEPFNFLTTWNSISASFVKDVIFFFTHALWFE
jgi:hypothetical protein